MSAEFEEELPKPFINTWQRIISIWEEITIPTRNSNIPNTPMGGFEWVDIDPTEIHNLAKLEDKGYLLEVNVRYPKELHDSHNDLPFMCEKKLMGGVEKLVPNLHNKKNYVVHIRALDQALRQG